MMFENLNLGESLDEELFDHWLDSGRESKIRYSYLVILWDEVEKDFRPVYLEDREELERYVENKGVAVGDLVVGAYDLFSESKVL